MTTPTLFGLLLLPAALPSVDEDWERVVAEAVRPLERADSPGGVVAVLRSGELVTSRAFGLADAGGARKESTRAEEKRARKREELLARLENVYRELDDSI